ncbi:hypothetical protein E6R60_05820 [Streptomyces sp. A0642]|uniref:hypothetical protein n=1 Tax=Streptomyces sp. A0642 TaxID=2563100 RepID=UPI0010A2A087|nr:hypothetical protein [Streptomyces sp. A0642]THA78401.1 hypothetical protein E6R60_05820 [Streptomyces sp. A0642]
MAAISTASGFPRWVGARVTYSWPGIYATTATRAPDGSLRIQLQVDVPPIRGALYGAWLALRLRCKGY